MNFIYSWNADISFFHEEKEVLGFLCYNKKITGKGPAEREYIMSICNLCPRACKIERKISVKDKGNVGYCRSAMLPVISRAALHHWEEPCIAGSRGAGTVFFAGCNLSCVYCQNYEISERRKGIEVSVERLREIYFELIAKGAHNIDLVTPTHYTHAIFQSLRDPLPVPVVYNCGGYESVHTVAFLRNKVQCWLPDLKYADSSAAARYSDAPDYFEKATAAIEQMFRQTGPYEIDSSGILRKGVLIRHLILPGQVENTKKVLEYVADTFAPGEVLFSLMRQYVPCGRAAEYPEINRPITDEEYEECESYMEELGIVDGYVQQKASSDKMFIPAFDGTGVLKREE